MTDVQFLFPALDETVAQARHAGDAQGLRIALTVVGQLAVDEGNYQLAAEALEEALAVSRELNDVYGTSTILVALGRLATARGDYVAAQELLEDSRKLDPGDRFENALVLAHLGRVALAEGDLDRAGQLFDEALAAGTRSIDGMLGAGEVAAARGDIDTASDLLTDVLAESEACGLRLLTARALYALGNLARVEGKVAEAEACHYRALRLRDQLGSRPGLAESLDAIGGLAAAAGDGERAARLLAAAESLRSTGGYARASIEARVAVADLNAARATLSPKEFDAGWAQGRALTADEAVGYALRGRGPRARPSLSGWDSLTPAEREAARLVSEGLTNPEVAARMFVSRNTVKKYLTTAFAKLGVTSRMDLVREAAQREAVGRQRA